jgi:hypothetical protein
VLGSPYVSAPRKVDRGSACKEPKEAAITG